MNRQSTALAAAGVVTAAVLAGAIEGAMAGLVVLAYGIAGLWLYRRRRGEQRYAGERVAAVDAVCLLAADLRAGQAVPTALRAAYAELDARGASDGDGDRGPVSGAQAVLGRLSAAVQLAEACGAPLADVLDRLDGHLRAMDRARRSGQAQAAGARASAALLAGLPVAGVGLGYLVGADPTHVLLHTGLGAACLAGAIVLQLAGLAWSLRISRLEWPT